MKTILSIIFVFLTSHLLHAQPLSLIEERDLLVRVNAHFNPHLISNTQTIRTHAKCGTPLILELKDKWPRLGKQTQKSISSLLQFDRPQLPHSIISPSGRFKIHFTQTGPNAVDPKDDDRNNIPDYVDETARSFDRAWALEIDQLGYRPPLSDGDAYYDIYIQNLAVRSAYGEAYPEAGAFETTTSSYIIIDNNFTDNIYATRGLDGLHVTAAHEFFHAIQFAYYSNFNASWLQELTAVWMEDVAYDDVNDYHQYLPGFFNEPTASIDRISGTYHLGASVFAHHLHQIYGIDAIRKIWESLATQAPRNDILSAVNAGLPPGGFETLLPRFAFWNYLTGDRYGYYREAHAYPNVPVQTLTPGRSITNDIDHLAYDYIALDTQTLPTNLHLNFDLDPNAQWNILVARIRGSRAEVTYTDQPQINIPNTSRYDQIICIPTVTNLSGQNYQYTCTAMPSTASGLAISLVGDLNKNGQVEFADFLDFSIGFGAKPTTPTYQISHDLNGDGAINMHDFLIFVSHFGESSSTF